MFTHVIFAFLSSSEKLRALYAGLWNVLIYEWPWRRRTRYKERKKVHKEETQDMIYIKRNSCLSLLPSNGYDNRNNNNNNNINNKNNKREHLYRIAPNYPSTVVKGILLK